jgi:hypothetical protein
VPAFRSGIAQQLLELGRYCCGWSPDEVRKEDGNEVRVKQLSEEDEEQELWQGDSSMEEG